MEEFAEPVETKLERCKHLLGQLTSERQSWEPLWKEIDTYVLPDRCQWETTDHNRGDMRSTAIIDSTAEKAIRTLEAGMFTGMVSPARPWFQYSVRDKDLAAWGPAKQWLSHCSEIVRDAFRGSNWYQEVPSAFGNMGGFGTHAMIMEADQEEVFRFYNQPIGAYYLACSDRNVVDTIVRKMSLTARQCVRMFGQKSVSDRTRGLYANTATRESAVEVVHVVTPNEDYDPRKIGPRGKRWASIWYESASTDGLLRESGFDYFPALCPRWLTVGRNVYGFGPGRLIRGDSKALQAYERNSLSAVALQGKPPMQGPSGLDGGGVNMVPGGYTTYDETKGPNGLKPLIPPGTFDIQGVELKAAQARGRILAGCYNDMFLMLANSDRRQITAEEIRGRQEEKLLELGPVWERSNDEMLDPAVRHAFTFCDRRGMLPPPPEELQGADLTIEYVGTLGQVQRMLNLGSIDRIIGTVGNMAQAHPEALDKIDADAAIDRYAEALNVPWDVVRTTKQANGRRAARASAAQQQAAAEQAVQVAQGAKLLSETDTRTPSALTDLIQAQTGATF